jgi:hypothetical protein
MSSRTRNMEKLIYYCGDIKAKKSEYETIKEVQNKYKRLMKLNEKVLSLSKSVNEDDEIKIIENTYFKLFCYNEYQNDIFGTGFLEHYQNILKNAGFILSEIGVEQKLDKEAEKELTELTNIIEDTKFDEFIEAFNEIETEEDLEKIEEIKDKHPILNGRAKLLNINEKSDAEKYKIFLTDEYSLRHYFDLLNLFKKHEYIQNKLKEKKKASFGVQTISTIHTKILLLEQFEKHYKINRFDFKFDTIDDTNVISEAFQELYSNTFPRQTVKKFDTKYNLLKIYVNMIKTICGDIPIITSKYGKVNKKCCLVYNFNKEVIQDIIKLCKLNNPTLKNFDLDLVLKMVDIKPEEKFNDLYNDEDTTINNYLFNKNNFKKYIK